MSIFGKNKRKLIPPNAVFRITQAGEEELEKFKGDDDQAILVALKTGGSSTAEEIAANSGLGKGAVEKRISALANKQLVQYISSNASNAVSEE